MWKQIWESSLFILNLHLPIAVMKLISAILIEIVCPWRERITVLHTLAVF